MIDQRKTVSSSTSPKDCQIDQRKTKISIFEKKNWDKTEIEIIPIFFTVCLVDQETIDVVK